MYAPSVVPVILGLEHQTHFLRYKTGDQFKKKNNNKKPLPFVTETWKFVVLNVYKFPAKHLKWTASHIVRDASGIKNAHTAHTHTHTFLLDMKNYVAYKNFDVHVTPYCR